MKTPQMNTKLIALFLKVKIHSSQKKKKKGTIFTPYIFNPTKNKHTKSY
jgi:hypothetical protein